jgi:2-oxoacid:acceptor oxidoreductase gamma subunit (pyruvate/2-ketoisovalerate family)
MESHQWGIRLGQLIEVRWHGRGGQGAVTAAQILAEAAYLEGYKGVQAFPYFGAERRGAPIIAFTRMSDEEIRVRSQIYNPDFVVVLDSTLLGLIRPNEGLKEGGTIIVNSSKEPYELNLKGNFQVCTTDVTTVAQELGLIVAGIPVLNTPILGAFSKITGLVSLETLTKIIEKKWHGEIGKRNAHAAKITFQKTISC